MAGLAPLAPFLWGDDGTVQTPEDAARLRAVAAALAQSNRVPKDVGEGLSSVGDALLYRANMGRAADAEKTGMAQAASEIAGLGDNPDRAALTAALSDPWVTSNPGQAAVVQALLGRNLAASDPGAALDREYKQAQIDALKAKPAQPLINAGNGQIYDPNAQTWIKANAATGSTTAPPVSFTDAGTLDPAAQDAFLKSLSPDDATNIQGITDYRIDPTKLASIRGGGDSERQRLLTLAQQYDPTFDMSQFGARAAAKKAYTTGPQGQTITSANTVIGHLANLDADAAKLNNGDFTPLNWLGNTVKEMNSDPVLATFKSDQKAVASELAKFFKGTGSTDMTTTEEWMNVFDKNVGKDATHAVVSNIIGNLMKSRLDEMRSQYTAAMGKPADFKFITPETDAVLQKMGIKSSDLDPAMAAASTAPAADGSGPVYATNPQTNQRIMLVNGQWVPAQ